MFTSIVIISLITLNLSAIILLANIERKYQDFGNWSNASEGYSDITHSIYNKVIACFSLSALAGAIEIVWFMLSDNTFGLIRHCITSVFDNFGQIAGYLFYLALYSGLVSQVATSIYILERERSSVHRWWMIPLAAGGTLSLLIALQWLIIPAIIIGSLTTLSLWIALTNSTIQQASAAISAHKAAQQERIRQNTLAQYKAAWEKEQAEYRPTGLLRWKKDWDARLSSASSDRTSSYVPQQTTEPHNDTTKRSKSHFPQDDGYGNKQNTRYDHLSWEFNAHMHDCLWFWGNNRCSIGERGPCNYSSDQRDCPYFRESDNYRAKVDKYYKDGTY